MSLDSLRRVGEAPRVVASPGIDPIEIAPWELPTGRELVARVLEVKGDEAVLAWGRRRLVAQVEPRLEPGSMVGLRVQESGADRVLLRVLYVVAEGTAAPRPDPRAELLVSLGLPDDARNRAIVSALARAGLAVTAEEVRAVRQTLVRLGATDLAAPAAIWLRQVGLPQTAASLALAQALHAGDVSDAPLWQRVWSLLARRHRTAVERERLAAALALSEPGGSPRRLAALLERAARSLWTPLERKLADGDENWVRLDGRATLHRLRTGLAETPDSALDQALQELATRLEARQVSNAVVDGPLRLEIPLLIGADIQVATLLVDSESQSDQETEQARASGAGIRRVVLELELSRLGPLRAELARVGDEFCCWLSATEPDVFLWASQRTDDLARRLEEALGMPVAVRWFYEPARAAAIGDQAPVDVVT